MKYIFATLITLSFLLIWDKAFSEIIVTDNLLSNSTFTGGNTNWTNHGSTQQHHTNYGNECNPNTAGNWATTCGITKGSLATVDNGGVSQTIKLSEKTNMTEAEIQNGFTSTMSNDIWFWNGQDSVTMTQELTDSSGTTTTQNRVVTNSHNYYQTYTDTAIIGNNTSTDYDIKVKLDIDDVQNCTGHCGPDIDNVELKVSYTYINPLEEDAQEIIDDIAEDISDTIDDINWEEEEYTWDDSWQDDYSWEEEYTWEDEYTWEEDFYFEEEYDTSWDEVFEMEEVYFEEFEETVFFEEFEEITFEEIPNEVFLENEFTETSVMEEIFEEEFEEDFNTFLEDTGMEEEFAQFLEDEGMTQEEFFEEITEEGFDDEFTEESFEEFEEPLEESTVTEESIPEAIDSEEEGIETEITESKEQEVAQNESTEESEDIQEEESNSEGTEDSEVQTADSEEQDSVQSEGREDVDTDKGIATNVARVESKLKQKLKAIAKQIAKVTKVNTQNLSKEDIFFKNNTALNAYKKIQFYKSKDIYTDANLDLFNQIDLGVYDKDIYTNITLASYTQNDPVEVHRVQLHNAQEKTKRLQLELEAMKNENY
jgi:hypothetical protein